MAGNFGYCQDPYCDNPEEPCRLNRVRYTESLTNGGWICDGCLEGWMDTQEFIEANRLEMSECGENTGDVLVI